MAAACMAASATETFLTSTDFQLGQKYTVCNEAVQVQMAPAAKAPTAAEVAGTYVGATMARDTIPSSTAPTFTVVGDSMSVTGITASHNIAIKGVYADGKITIAPGQVSYTSSTYGDCALYPMVNATQYSSTTDIVFAVDEDGNLTLTNGCTGFIVVILDGTYKGYTLGAVLNGGYKAYKANGTIKSNLVNNDYSAATTPTSEYSTYVEFTEDGGVVYGVDNMTYCTFKNLDEEGNVQFIQDPAYYYSSSYKCAYMCQGVKSSTGTFNFYPTQGPTAVVDKTAGTITLGDWMFAMENATTANSYAVLNGRKNGSVVTFPPQEPTAISDVNVAKTVKARKVIENGQIVIYNGDVKYNVMGQEIK